MIDWKKRVYFGSPPAREQMPNKSIRLRREQYRHLERLCNDLRKSESEILREAFDLFCEKYRSVLERGPTVESLADRARRDPDSQTLADLRKELGYLYGVDGMRVAAARLECEEVLVGRTLQMAGPRLPDFLPDSDVILRPTYKPKDAANYLLGD